ncbi:uncharacterized protein LOC132736916 [Ruditapes philippinarum]|uniref:uncharacterized protein LOC132736916 n=1 Tax=Ruditapes philippinarum TaxID=129788 RepID=UPI00295A7461|nr:uncharacterized protein LOC132736916 [Ruditapes philippinarum]
MKKYYFNDTHCDVEHIVDEQMPDGCVPKTLTLIGTYTMGSGSQSMQINGWSGKVLNETWTYATTVNDCTTVSYTILGTQPDGTKISETAQFADIVQQRNSYDGVFDVPDHCKHGTSVVGK